MASFGGAPIVDTARKGAAALRTTKCTLQVLESEFSIKVAQNNAQVLELLSTHSFWVL